MSKSDTKHKRGKQSLPEEVEDVASMDERKPGDDPQTSAADEPPLEEQVQIAAAERDAYYDRWIRAQAELENYRKRVQKESEQARQYQALPVVRALLPALDNLQRAVAAAESAGQGGELVDGVRMVVRQFDEILRQHSVQPIEAVGRPFDPNLHEAVQHVPSAEYPPMTVLEEIERGYTLHDRVVRPSKVIVSSGPPPDNPKLETPEN